INKTLREAGSNAKEIYVSLADKDFIFRPLEMPAMKKRDIESSLVYEIEKYIPFKIEELVWDYDYVNFSKERKIGLSFIGIKEDNFEKVKAILSRLELKAAIIEPSCVSLIRVIKSIKKFSQFNNFAILDFTQGEASFTFFQQDLPVFNRYFVVPKKEGSIDLDNFIETVNFSFQYFKREFKNYKLDKFVVVGNSNVDKLVSSLKEGLQIEIEPVSFFDLTKRNDAKVESVKALGVTGLQESSYKFKPCLRKTEERFISLGGASSKVALNVGLLSLLVGVGIVGITFLSLVLGFGVGEKRNILRKKESNLIIPEALSQLTWLEREDVVRSEEESVSSLKNVVSSFIRFSSFFEEIATNAMLPNRLWLIDLSIVNYQQETRGTLDGYIFRDDDYEERLGVDEFISNLKQSGTVELIFSKVRLKSSNRDKIDNFEVTRFSIGLEN
ncbi:MAG: pilus assembly protein PilM, partial [Candidatus Omnitrophica bacterium]|nr:pilus assembly protein PilM [Candidatus Omnitrophota bacterium]